MYGVSVVGSYVECVEIVLEVGCDMVFVCNNLKGVEVIFDGLEKCFVNLFYNDL